jgi:hypothetical protein
MKIKRSKIITVMMKSTIIKNKGTMTDDVENPGPSFGQAQKSGRVKSLLK